MHSFRLFLENDSNLDTNWLVLADAIEEERHDTIVTMLYQTLKAESEFSLTESLSQCADPNIVTDEEIAAAWPPDGYVVDDYLTDDDIERIRADNLIRHRRDLTGTTSTSSAFPYSDIIRIGMNRPAMLEILRKVNKRDLHPQVLSISMNIDKFFRNRKLHISHMVWEGEFASHLLFMNRSFLTYGELGVPFITRFSHTDSLVKLFDKGGFSGGFGNMNWSGFDRSAPKE